METNQSQINQTEAKCSSHASLHSLTFCGLPFLGLSRQRLFAPYPTYKHVVTMNAELIVRANEDTRLKTIVHRAFATFDGHLPYLLARMTNWTTSIEKIAGSDLIYDIAKNAAENKERIYLLGGSKESNHGALIKLREQFGVEIQGYSPPFAAYPYPKETEERIAQEIEAFKPHYLLVAFGALKQELWIDDHKELLVKLGVKMAVGVGGTFDFVSGRIRRAPKILQLLCLEGVFRLLVEPKFFRVKRLLLSLKFFKYL